MSTLTEETRLSDDEWLKRYDAQITKRSDYQGSYSHDTSAGLEMRDSFENDPEGAADEEMSYWGDDSDE